MVKILLTRVDGRPHLKQDSVQFEYQGRPLVMASRDVLVDCGAHSCFANPATLAELSGTPLVEIMHELTRLADRTREDLVEMSGTMWGRFEIFGTVTNVTNRAIGGLRLPEVTVIIDGNQVGPIALGSTIATATNGLCLLGIGFIDLVTLILPKGNSGWIEI